MTKHQSRTRVAEAVQEQLRGLLAESALSAKRREEDLCALKESLKDLRATVRCKDRVIKQQQRHLSVAQEKIKTLTQSNRRLQLRVIDLETEVHHLKLTLEQANRAAAQLADEADESATAAAQFASAAVAEEEASRARVAAADRRAESRTVRMQSKLSKQEEHHARLQRRSADTIEQQQEQVRLLRKRVLEVEQERDDMQLQRDDKSRAVNRAQRAKSHHKSLSAALKTARESDRQQQRQLQDDLAASETTVKALEGTVAALQAQIHAATMNADKQTVLRLQRSEHKGQFNDNAFELARSLLMLGIPVVKVAPAISAVLSSLGIEVDKQPTISLARCAHQQSKVLVQAHAHSVLARDHPDQVNTLHHDASPKYGRELMNVSVTQSYWDAKTSQVVQKSTVLPFCQPEGASATQEAQAIRDVISVLNRMAPDGSPYLDVIGTADAVISDQASTAIKVGVELGFCKETSFPCAMHACQNQSLVLTEAFDEWARQALHVAEEDLGIAPSDAVAGEDMPDSRFAVFVWEFHKLFIDGRYHLSARRSFQDWLGQAGNRERNSAVDVLRAAPALIGSRFVQQHKLIQCMVVLWPLAKTFLEEVWRPHATLKSGKPNNLVMNMIQYAQQSWRSVALRAGAIVYNDIVSPQFFEVVFANTQHDVGVLARSLYAEVNTLLDDTGIILSRLAKKEPLVSPSFFSVLSSAKTSPHSRGCHQQCAAAARLSTSDADDDAVALALVHALRWIGKAGHHYFRQHLAGGHLNPAKTDDSLKRKLLLVPAHNTLSESAFALADSQLGHKSTSMSVSSVSMYTMALMNKTLNWWSELNDEQRQRHAKNSMDKRRQKLLADKDKRDDEAARVALRERLASEKVRVATAEQNRRLRQMAAMDTTLLSTVAAVDEGLAACTSKKQRVTLLTSQIKAYKFRVAALLPGEVASNKGLWTFSRIAEADLVIKVHDIVTQYGSIDLSTARAGPKGVPFDTRVPRRLSQTASIGPSAALEKKAAGWAKYAASVDSIFGSAAPQSVSGSDKP